MCRASLLAIADEQYPALAAAAAGLRSLRISAAPRFTCKGLLHLTRLEQLSEIIVDGCNTVYAYGADGAMAAACARLGIQHDEIGDVRNAQQQDFSMSCRDYYWVSSKGSHWQLQGSCGSCRCCQQGSNCTVVTSLRFRLQHMLCQFARLLSKVCHCTAEIHVM